jgi:hypothetical protein
VGLAGCRARAGGAEGGPGARAEAMFREEAVERDIPPVWAIPSPPRGRGPGQTTPLPRISVPRISSPTSEGVED